MSRSVSSRVSEPTRAASSPAAMRAVQPAVVRTMLADLPGQTDELLMACFGISYNTWRKIRAGEPIRRSVADRLERRIAGGA